jgi:uncharacterized OB-fold protein
MQTELYQCSLCSKIVVPHAGTEVFCWFCDGRNLVLLGSPVRALIESYVRIYVPPVALANEPPYFVATAKLVDGTRIVGRVCGEVEGSGVMQSGVSVTVRGDDMLGLSFTLEKE